MGAFANWSEGFWPTESTTRLAGGQTLLVVDFEPPAELLVHYFSELPRFVVLPCIPEMPIAGCEYFIFRTRTNPLQWSESVDALLGKEIDTVVFWLPPDEIYGQTLLKLRRLGVQQIAFLGQGIMQRSPLEQVCRTRARNLKRRVLQKLHLQKQETELSVESCQTVLHAALPRRKVTDTRLKIAHFIQTLNSRGAEQQVCHAALAAKRAGHEVKVFTRLSLVGEDAHHLPTLAAAEIPAYLLGSQFSERVPEQWERAGFTAALRLLPTELRRMASDLLGELLADPVDVLHCYVDDCNSVGAVAGCLAGVPALVLSFRNGNPSHFPGLYRSYMKPWYEVVRGRKGVRFSSNSAAGARDYEAWLALPPNSVPVIPNAFVPPPTPRAEDVSKWRAELGIPAEAPVLAGVFRLQPEKRPVYFLECVAKIREKIPNLHVVQAGVGLLEHETRTAIERLKLSECVHLLGQRDDVPTLLANSQVLLLVSTWEGTPNIVLEAQHAGCVPVVTRAGGSPEALDDGRTGVLVELDDLACTVNAVVELLANPTRRQQMAEAGKQFVTERFSLAALHASNISLYQEALSD